MITRKRVLAAALTVAMSMGAVGGAVYAATEHYQDSTVRAGWNQWAEHWANSVSKDYEKVALTPGADETKMNFAWYSKNDGNATPQVAVADNPQMTNAKMFTGNSVPAVEGYNTNYVTVDGLKPNTNYYYVYYKNGQPAETANFLTKSFDHYKLLFVGDPQIGASKGQATSLGDTLENKSELNTAARNDAYSWENTLNVAMANNPDVSFILSAGDQINKNVNGR
ncbi:MAG: fibronectin type III domain-containing protein, partial [Eubacteriales bacterium]|nr:fibronectin type III domain-containing protein [Eubacteriales bacterium]